MAEYREIPAHAVPDGIRFDTMRRDQGQIIEISWGDFGRAENGPGDPYKRVIDRSTGKTTYYVRGKKLAKAK